MWNTSIFISEVVGTFALVFMVLFVVMSSKSKIINLKVATRPIFVALGIALSLTFSIIISLGVGKIISEGKAPGYVNPAVAFMHAIAINNFNDLLPAIAGEFFGTVIASLIALIIAIYIYGKNPLEMENVKATFSFPETKNQKLISGELYASMIFFVGVITAIFLNIGVATSLIVGLSIFLVLITFGLKFVLVLNPFAYLIPMVFGLLITKPQNCHQAFKEVVLTLSTNVLVATAMGGIVYGLTQI